MYLSRLILNPRSRRVQKEIADPYQLHRSLMRAFPDDLAEGDERVLFRLETQPPSASPFDPAQDEIRTGRSGALTLLVQSLALPDWSWLAEPEARGYLLPVGEPNPAVKPFDLSLAPGQVLAFRLRANPTARRRLPDGTRKRVGLCREEEQMDWLKRKAEQGGFRLLSARASNEAIVHGVIRRDEETQKPHLLTVQPDLPDLGSEEPVVATEKTHKLHLFAVQFDGLLQVTDPDRLRETVQRGVGSGKALGFGLLSLARPPA